MDLGPERLLRTVVDLVAEATTDSGLHGEVLRAQREFFGGSELPPGPAQELARGRFCEWFVLERESEHLGARPIDVLGGVPDAVRRALRDSVCSLFLVEQCSPYVRVRDVGSNETHELQTDATLDVGDLVVGRLYPGEADAVLPSPSAAILREGTQVAAALQRDLERAGIGRRLTQAEIEAVLFRNAAELQATQARRVPPERLEARLDSLLRAGGDRAHSAATISEALEAAASGPGQVIGPVLDALAFDTSVDLEAMRTAMLELWNEHRLRALERSREPAPRQAEAPRRTVIDRDARGLGATIADRIEQGLAAHEDIEELFADVEGMLGDESDEDEDPADEGAGALAGDLDALVQEFSWERSLDADSATGQILAEFVEHQTQLPVPGVYLEAIPARELVSFLLRAYLTAAPDQRSDAVRTRFAALAAFYVWAEETQMYELASTLAECRVAIVEPLERLQRASLALSQAAATAQRPRVLRVQRIEAGEVEVVGSETMPTWLDVPEAAVDLRVDDLLLAAMTADRQKGLVLQGPVVVLPAAAADLLE
ncbi:MAG: hypothetical protein R3F56_14235 [Planctomycetota bacterium]